MFDAKSAGHVGVDYFYPWGLCFGAMHKVWHFYLNAWASANAFDNTIDVPVQDPGSRDLLGTCVC